ALETAAIEYALCTCCSRRSIIRIRPPRFLAVSSRRAATHRLMPGCTLKRAAGAEFADARITWLSRPPAKRRRGTRTRALRAPLRRARTRDYGNRSGRLSHLAVRHGRSVVARLRYAVRATWPRRGHAARH